jgi:sterol desaturase/sphingolipid hydroxylase (fatty acid hydroxylase superfamily)
VDARAIAIAIPFFLVLIGVEILVDRARVRRGLPPLYRFADAITSLSCGVGQQVLGVLVLGAVGVAAYAGLYTHARLFDLPAGSPLVWALAFVLTDLGYYAYHRASHRVNFFWATHVVHHSSEEYNLSTALRQSWFTTITSWLFYVPLALMGIPPIVFALCTTLNTLYQFWIHTRALGKLGWFERVFNTPSHHRVHHAIDPEYIDKNYAGVFIVWDKLFGSFIEERNEPAYGAVKPLESFDPVWANFEGFAKLWQMSRATKGLGDKLRVWVMPPEWRPADLGGVVPIPPVPADRRKYDVPTTRALNLYVASQFAVAVGVVFVMLWFKSELGLAERATLAGLTLWALFGWGALFERRRHAVLLEGLRLVATAAGLSWIASTTSVASPAIAASVMLSVASALLLARGRKLPEPSLAEPTAAE